MPSADGLRRVPWRLRYDYGERAASQLRRLAVLATNVHADVRIAPTARLGPGFRLYMPEGGTFHVGHGCDLRRDFVCHVYDGASVVIGPGTTFTDAALVQISTSLTIGARAVFGQSVLLADGNHRWRDPDRHLLDQGYDFHPLDVGAGAVVMSKCTVLASLGERAVVGAHSLVTEPAEPFTFVAGAPARVVERYGRDARPRDAGTG